MNLTPEEQSVYDLIAANDRITQQQIAKSERWLGLHEKYEAHLPINPKASTLRKIRQIVRTMRIDKGVTILSDTRGYYLLKNNDEAKEFMDRLEKSARSSAKSFMCTYEIMRKNFGIESQYFEKETEKINVRAHTRHVHKPNTTNGLKPLFDL